MPEADEPAPRALCISAVQWRNAPSGVLLTLSEFLGPGDTLSMRTVSRTMDATMSRCDPLTRALLEARDRHREALGLLQRAQAQLASQGSAGIPAELERYGYTAYVASTRVALDAATAQVKLDRRLQRVVQSRLQLLARRANRLTADGVSPRNMRATVTALADLSAQVGRIDAAVRMCRASTKLAPRDWMPWLGMRHRLLHANRIEEAIEADRMLSRLRRCDLPDIPFTLHVMLLRGDMEGLAGLLQDQPDIPLELRAMAEHTLGRAEESAATLRLMQRPHLSNQYELALVHAWRGDTRAALQCLGGAVLQGQFAEVAESVHSVFFEAIWSDRDAQRWLRRLHLAPDQLAPILSTVTLPTASGVGEWERIEGAGHLPG